ncbi:MAG: hypothetical protein ACPG7P_03510, partial [Candidatus Puniceispirillaceae bacterium]
MQLKRRFTTSGDAPFAALEFRFASSEIRNPDGTVEMIADNIVPTPNPPPMKEEDIKKAEPSIKVYPTHHGVKNHVPLIESSKTDIHRAVV